MGKIIVGQKSPKTVDIGGFMVARNKNVATKENKSGITAEEKTKKTEDAQQVQQQENARLQRLSEIKTMPIEEQLSLLLAEGYEDEAKELSERLAAEQEQGQEKTDEGTGEENQGAEAQVDGTTTELNNDDDNAEPSEPAEAITAAEKPEKKKGGRPKKTESK